MLSWLLVSSRATPAEPSAVRQLFSAPQLWSLREDARDMFFHGFDSFVRHGHPWDELKPLSCAPRRWDERSRGTLDDVLGGYHLTLVDSLDSLVLMGDVAGFRSAVRTLRRDLSFDRDVTVSVFESSIRVLGGLLSGHALATHPRLSGTLGHDYDGVLLTLAADLASRLLPAFSTPTHLPVHRINLRRGQVPGAGSETCPAAAGTLLVEFAMLSRLTRNNTFELAARRAVDVLWERRLMPFSLVGQTIDVESGQWRSSKLVLGAGVDSFYEYLLKAAILLDDEPLMRRFLQAY